MQDWVNEGENVRVERVPVVVVVRVGKVSVSVTVNEAVTLEVGLRDGVLVGEGEGVLVCENEGDAGDTVQETVLLDGVDVSELQELVRVAE